MAWDEIPTERNLAELEMKNLQLERYIQDFLGRLSIYVEAVRIKDKPFQETYEEIFSESLESKENDILRHLGKMMQNLLMLGYCNSREVYRKKNIEWRSRIILHKSHSQDVLDSDQNTSTDIVRGTDSRLSDAYQRAIRLYKIDIKKYPELRSGLEFIPENCPWNVSELLADSIRNLLLALPNRFMSDEEEKDKKMWQRYDDE